MTTVRRALAFSFAERYALIALGLLSNVLVARLLTPEEIGLYSVSLAVIGIAHVLRDFGIGTFLIQEKNLQDDHIRTAFGLSLLIGASLFVLVLAGAPLTGRFYAEEQLVETIRISSLNFLALPFCTISIALLRREMQFKRLVIVTLGATFAVVLTTVSLAYAGFGPNSMAIGSVVGNVLTGIGAWCARAERRLLAPSLSQWRSLLRFGGQSSVTNIVTSIAADANDLVVGKLLGFQPVAILSRAQGLMNLFHRDLMTAARNVAFPSFAATNRAGLDLEPNYAQSVAMITALAWPFYGLMSIYAFEVLRLLFGPQWDAARPLVPIFCAAGAIAALYNLIPVLLLAIGRIDLLMRVELVVQPARLALVVAAAYRFETVEACAVAYAAGTVISAPAFYFAKERAMSRNPSALLKGIGRSSVVAIVTITPALIHAQASGFERISPIPVWELLLVVTICASAWFASARATGHPMARERWFLRAEAKVFNLFRTHAKPSN